MNVHSPTKTEIFLLLALKQTARQNSFARDDEKLLFEIESDERTKDLTEEDFPVLFKQLGKKDAGKLRRLLANYQNKTEDEKAIWRKKTESAIGADEEFIDENIHRSHIEDALEKEVPAIRKIIEDVGKNEESATQNPNNRLLKKNIRRAFARQFVALREVPKATAFDRLSGTQLARLIRRAGIREVSIACLRIEAVESVAAFLRQFSTEDARTIAAELSNPPEISSERLDFAENLVRTAFEIEPNPASMLDWLGIWLTGVLLCRSLNVRIDYTKQKLPLEFASRLPEIIEEKCRRTPLNLQAEISVEIERLAEEILSAEDIR